ncbi:replication restart helicase PriA [Francisella frigiditurris]|uniref:Replication restart protein PriA n=1 Tax=Francisella frigiditurris TaxID=1542390 RepID=A0A1J0KW63_9GAMM|nr:primosomal protein N' [Francisella frigiditurris]APC97922.1 primosomal protein N' [Francisella frigiditurris]
MIVKVALAVPPFYLLDYSIDIEIKLFQRVLVPVGNRKLIGFITDTNVEVNYDHSKIKSIVKILDDNCVLISENIQKLIQWTAKYYHSDLYSVTKLALPNDYFKKEIVNPKEETFLSVDINILSNIKLTAKQQLLVEEIGENTYLLNEIKNLGYSDGIIRALLNKNILVKSTKIKALVPDANTKGSNKKLTNEQQEALNILLENGGFKTFLLYGVTGSGKTEVYLQTIQNYVDKGKQALVLIPEINLTPQTLKRFKDRFSNQNIVSLHSKLTESDRLTNWHYIKKGIANIVIATRSGVLADFKDLGIIVVDEEHDSSFKQQTSTIRYSARDLAILRAKFADIPIILGSATPSIESYYNVINKKYNLLKLTERVSKYASAQVKIIDLRSAIVSNGLSNILVSLLEKNIQKHEQSLLFVNKLGYAKALVCNSCGDAVECKKCDKPYTLHTCPNQYLACHFCGDKRQIVIQCNSCDSTELFPYGVGTEKIQSALKEKFPYNEIVRFDRENIKNNRDLDKIIDEITNNKIDVIVGTQMVAKGHHFENITLVGLINADAGFYSTDFHAIEKNAQLIIQVAGRAGRGDKEGRVLLQTYQPENPILQKLIQTDYLEFLDYLLEQRKALNYPPYTYQAQIIAEAKKEADVLNFLNNLYDTVSSCENISITKPLPATHLKKNNIYKYSLLITASERKDINSFINYVRRFLEISENKAIKVYFDVDPIELI